MVNFVTWSRMVGSTVRSSILDHIFVKDPTLVKNICSLQSLFGDHVMLMFEIKKNCFKNVIKIIPINYG